MFVLFVQLFFILDVVQAGVWKHRQDLKSNKLKELGNSLPVSVLCSRAVSTNVKYKNAWLNQKKWGKDNLGVNAFPVLPFFLSLYLTTNSNLVIRPPLLRPQFMVSNGHTTSREFHLL